MRGVAGGGESSNPFLTSRFPANSSYLSLYPEILALKQDYLSLHMNTRFQGDVDIINIPGVRCHPLDPSQEPGMSPSITQRGMTCKTIFDCTVPFSQKNRFQRAKFLEVDHTRFLEKALR